jgi:nitrogen regulatory protein PII
MKMIWAVIQPEAARQVILALDRAGIGGMTRFSVTGDGRELSSTPAASGSRDHAREMLMIAVPDNDVAKTVTIIRAEAKSGSKGPDGNGSPGDGKIFVTYIEDAFPIRTAGRTDGERKKHETDHRDPP